MTHLIPFNKQFSSSAELVTIGKQGLVYHPEYIASLFSHKVCKSTAKSYLHLLYLVEEEKGSAEI